MNLVTAVQAYGLRFEIPTNDTVVGACLREHGEFARIELDFLSEFAGPLVDVGANLGAIALPFAQRHPQAEVLAIEAQPQIAHLLRSNIQRNGLLNVTALEAVAGEAVGRVDIPLFDLGESANFGASSLYEKGRSLTATQMIRLDDVAPQETQIVKIDVEGFEPRVLRGAGRLLRDGRPAWLVEISRERPNTTAAVRACLSDAGYRLFWFFSPFLSGPQDEIRGDVSIFASDDPPPWNLTPVGDSWPEHTTHFPYLSNYGLA